MAACLFCRGRKGAHGNGCPFIVSEEKRVVGLTEDEADLFGARADEWLNEEDASSPDLTMMMVRAQMIGLQKMMRDMLLPPPGKDAATVSLRSFVELSKSGEQFLSQLHEAAMKANKGSVEFEDTEEETPTVKALPAPKITKRLVKG